MLNTSSSCRVGKGDTVLVLNETWLSDTEDPFAHTSSEALHNVTVYLLRNIYDNQWNIGLIRDIFDTRNASLILSIPVNFDEKDTWYWKHDKLGKGTIQSKAPITLLDLA